MPTFENVIYEKQDLQDITLSCLVKILDGASLPYCEKHGVEHLWYATMTLAHALDNSRETQSDPRFLEENDDVKDWFIDGFLGYSKDELLDVLLANITDVDIHLEREFIAELYYEDAGCYEWGDFSEKQKEYNRKHLQAKLKKTIENWVDWEENQ